MAFLLARGVDDQNYVLIDSSGRDSGWRVMWERTHDGWTVAHADSSALSEVALGLGAFPTTEGAAAAVERMAV